MKPRLIWGAGIAVALIMIAMWLPKLAVVFAIVAVLMIGSHFWLRSSIDHYLAGRAPVDVTRFGKLLDDPSADPDVILAVFEETHRHLGLHRGHRIPLYPDDDLFEDLRLDPEDVYSDLPLAIAKRLGTDPAFLEKQPEPDAMTPRWLVHVFNTAPS